MLSPLYCQGCGGANTAEYRECSFCGQRLPSTEEVEQSILLKERYRLLVQVGVGGFGAVYKALDTHTNNKLVAIKEINLRGLSVQETIEATDRPLNNMAKRRPHHAQTSIVWECCCTTC